MGETNQNISGIIDHLFRHEAGRINAVLSRLLGMQNMDWANDIVQDTLLQAMHTWAYKGIPENPSAWLYRVSRNKAIDLLRRQKKFDQIRPAYSRLLDSEYSLEPTIHQLFLDSEISDSQLRMMFACCHPAINEEAQVALILKTLCGLSTAEIASAFLTNEESISKRIYRAKEMIRKLNIELDLPPAEELEERVDAVLKSLYLLFNEGYKASINDQLIRHELCDEALRLVCILAKHNQFSLPRVKAMAAIFCFQASRLNARVNDLGEIILLRAQDRNKWDRQLINQGFAWLEEAAEPFEVSLYHLEAAIASLHAAADKFENTDWRNIHHLYERLYQLAPTPIIAMNKAIASAFVNGWERALKELMDIKELESYHMYHASLGEVYFEMKDFENARRSFLRAFDLAHSSMEKHLFEEKIRLC